MEAIGVLMERRVGFLSEQTVKGRVAEADGNKACGRLEDGRLS